MNLNIGLPIAAWCLLIALSPLPWLCAWRDGRLVAACSDSRRNAPLRSFP